MNPRGNASTVITVDAACSKLYITELQLWVSNMLPAVADATLEISFGFNLGSALCRKALWCTYVYTSMYASHMNVSHHSQSSVQYRVCTLVMIGS